MRVTDEQIENFIGMTGESDNGLQECLLLDLRDARAQLADSEARCAALVADLEFMMENGAFKERIRALIASPPIAAFRERMEALERDAARVESWRDRIEELENRSARVEELEAEVERLRKALIELPWLEYASAQRAGCDPSAAWDCFASEAKEHIDRALTERKEESE